MITKVFHNIPLYNPYLFDRFSIIKIIHYKLLFVNRKSIYLAIVYINPIKLICILCIIVSCISCIKNKTDSVYKYEVSLPIKSLLFFKYPAVKQMLYSHYRVVQHHSRSGKSHYFAYLLTHFGLVAVYLAV